MCLSVVSFNSTKRRVGSFIFSYIGCRFITVCSEMRCSVVFGIRLRLLVINILWSSPAVNTASYYQRCVITYETVAVVHRRPHLQHLAYCSFNTHSQARYRLRNAISAYPTSIRCPPLGGFLSEYCYAIWHGKNRMAWLLDGEKISIICLRIFL